MKNSCAHPPLVEHIQDTGSTGETSLSPALSREDTHMSKQILMRKCAYEVRLGRGFQSRTTD